MFRQCSKKMAEIKFNLGEEIVLCPCKLRPGFPFSPHLTIHSQKWVNEGKTFEQMVKEFIYYNCSHEAGYYPHYYIENED